MKVYELARKRYENRKAFMTMVRGQLKLHGIPQRVLAERAGFSPSVLNRWITTNEETRVDPSYETMLVIDEALDQILEELV